MALLPSVSDEKSMGEKAIEAGIPVAAVLAGSLALYFVSRSAMSGASEASSISCTASVSRRFASALTMRPVVFLGTISCSLCLTRTIVLLAVIHLMHSPDIAWRAITMAALLVIPVTALTHFVVRGHQSCLVGF